MLHAFHLDDNGWFPNAVLIHDVSGNFYSTTLFGGHNGWGVVYKLDSSGNYTKFYNFNAGPDGGRSYGGVIRDPAGNLYGTTYIGGDPSGQGGTVYQLDSAGKLVVLHTFTGGHGGTDGYRPQAGLVRDGAGNLYGTTYKGGGSGCSGAHGCGTVFKVDAAGNYTVLYRFTGSGVNGDGSHPYAKLFRDASGNLYGTTYDGGAADQGTVFKLDTIGTETVLHSFTGQPFGPDGAFPRSNLVMDASGNLYGTTLLGGASGVGTVFRLDTNGNLTVLHTFTGGLDGGYPYAGLVIDAQGNLYGTTAGGGVADRGTVFKLTP